MMEVLSAMTANSTWSEGVDMSFTYRLKGGGWGQVLTETLQSACYDKSVFISIIQKIQFLPHRDTVHIDYKGLSVNDD